MDDLISRQAAIEYFMTNTNWHDEDGYPIEDAEEKRKLLEDYFNGISSAEPSCSEIPNSSDAINRQDAIDALDKRFDNIPMEQTAEILMLRKDLRELPAVQAERKKGEWLFNVRGSHGFTCPYCGTHKAFKHNFCPNCGADLRGERQK